LNRNDIEKHLIYKPFQSNCVAFILIFSTYFGEGKVFQP